MAERLFLRLDGDGVYAPETTVPAGTLRELPVPRALQAQVAHCLAYHEHIPAGVEITERVLPDGALHLIVDLHDPAQPVRVAGPSTEPVVLALRGEPMGLSLKLRPGAAPALFGVPANELAHRVLPWDALVPAAHRHLPALLQEATDAPTRLQYLSRTLLALQRQQGDSTAQRHALEAVDRLRRAAGQVAVGDLARALSLGERRLQQVFQSQLGLTPRAYRRLLRLHRCLRLLRGPALPGWAELAVDGGFYDQAHLVNEFRALCGLTPGQFLSRRRVAVSSKTGGPAAAYGAAPQGSTTQHKEQA